MPSISINSKDFENLGLNVKDIFKALSKSKGSNNNNNIKIKLKKNRKKVKPNLRKGNIVGRIDKMNPFPNYIPKFNPYNQYQGVGQSLLSIRTFLKWIKNNSKGNNISF